MDDPRPSILVVIPTTTAGRFRPFDVCLSSFYAYVAARGASLPFRVIGGPTDSPAPFWSMTGVLPGARNRGIREAFRLGADYLWWLDDDQPFQPTDLEALFARQVSRTERLSAFRKTFSLRRLITCRRRRIAPAS